MDKIIDTRAFRDAMGCFATGVTVVTAPNGEGGIVGMTANSFSSVSLDPPLVLWCLDKRSDRFRFFDAAEHFAINFLSNEQENISQACASKGITALPEGVRHSMTDSGAAYLDDTLASIDCIVETRHDAGDHVIFVGRVLDVVIHDNHDPLLFFKGAYRALD